MKIRIEKGKYAPFKKIELSLEDSLNVFLYRDEEEAKAFLDLLLGTASLEKGSIYFDKEDVSDLSPYQRKASYIYKDYQFYPNLSIIENISFALKDKTKEEREEGLRVIIKELAIEDLIDREISDLDATQKVRLALAKALIKKPKVIIIKEAFDDLETGSELLDLMKESGLSVIYATGSLDTAKSLANKYYLIEDGKIEEVKLNTTVLEA